MLRPSLSQISTKSDTCYAVVIAVAKRARQIADDLYERNEILEQKPVKSAVEEFSKGKFTIIEGSKIKSDKAE